VRFRLDIYGEDGPNFIDGGRQQRDTITGVVSFAASPGTMISADFMHQDYDLEGQQITFTPYVNKQGRTIVPAAFNPARQYGQGWTYTSALRQS
jgi:outer membrane receptor for ferric coprogen and ferric-rhodotorulic acid